MAKKAEEEEFRYIVRIAGTDVDGNKKVGYGITKIRGIGQRVGRIICGLAGVDPNKKVGHLTEKESEELEKIVTTFQEREVPSWLLNRPKDPKTGRNYHLITSDLAISLREDTGRMRKIRSYRGIRHERGLPVRGQRTRTSFRRGITVGVSRKAKAEAAKAKKLEERKKK